MHIMAKIAIFNVGMFDFAVCLHVIATSELLRANWALMALRPMYIGMMPPIRYSFMATNTSVQGWKCSRQLNK